MRDVKLNNSVEFGNTSRDILLKLDLDKEIARAKAAEETIAANTGMRVEAEIRDVVIPGAQTLRHVLFIRLLGKQGSTVISETSVDLDTEHNITEAKLEKSGTHWYLVFYSYEEDEETHKKHEEYRCCIDELVADYNTKINAEANTRALVDGQLADRITAEENRAKAAESELDNKKINLLGNEAGSGEPYHFTYFYDIQPQQDKYIINIDTITLDNNKTLTRYTKEIPAANYTFAGLESVEDKKNIDAVRNLLRGDNTHTGTEQIRIPYYFDMSANASEIKVTARGVSLNKDNNIVWEDTPTAKNTVTVPAASYIISGEAVSGTAGLMTAQDAADVREIIPAHIVAEEEIRSTADISLQNNINNEKDLRIAADNSLQTNINNEASIRSQADTTLQTNITNEVNARESAINAVNESINQEAITREQADNTLQSNINAEISNRTAADTNLENKKLDKVSTPGDCARAYVTTNDGGQGQRDIKSIRDANSIVYRDSEGVAQIVTPTPTSSKYQIANKEYVDSEKNRAIEAENSLRNDLNSEVSRATGTENDLQDQINNLKAKGRFLSVWDSTTGLPKTNPTVNPYTYQAGDYFIIGKVNESGTNYKPSGEQFVIGTASTDVETNVVKANDFYVYDGTAKNWILISATVRTYTFSEIAGSATDNTSLNTELTALQNNINNEKDLRITADNSLQVNINNEASLRVLADNSLQANISAEATARIAADNLKVNKSGDTMTGGLNVIANDGIIIGHTGQSEASGLKLTSDSALYGYINARKVTINSGDTSDNTVIDGTIIPRNKTLFTTEGGTLNGNLIISPEKSLSVGRYGNIYDDNTDKLIISDDLGITITSGGNVGIDATNTTINGTIIPRNKTLATSTDLATKVSKSGDAIEGDLTITSENTTADITSDGIDLANGDGNLVANLQINTAEGIALGLQNFETRNGAGIFAEDLDSVTVGLVGATVNNNINISASDATLTNMGSDDNSIAIKSYVDPKVITIASSQRYGETDIIIPTEEQKVILENLNNTFIKLDLNSVYQIFGLDSPVAWIRRNAIKELGTQENGAILYEFDVDSNTFKPDTLSMTYMGKIMLIYVYQASGSYAAYTGKLIVTYAKLGSTLDQQVADIRNALSDNGWVKAAIDTRVRKSGDTMTGMLTLPADGIKIGDTILTEEKLKKLLDLLDVMEAQ